MDSRGADLGKNKDKKCLRCGVTAIHWYIHSITLKGDQVVNVTVRNLSDEVYRAVQIQAVQHGRSTEAEIRDILGPAARPDGRVKIGSYLASIGRELGGLTDEEHALFEREHR